MVLGDETPETGVEGIVAVVAHHEVIVHLEGVGGSEATVDVDVTVGAEFGGGVVFINADSSAIEIPGGGVEVDGHAFGGDEDTVMTAIVGHRPVAGGDFGEKECAFERDDALDSRDTGERLEIADHRCGEGGDVDGGGGGLSGGYEALIEELTIVVGAYGAIVVDSHPEFLPCLGRDGASVGDDEIVELGVGGERLLHTVDVDVAIADSETLSREPDSALDIILTAIDGAVD